MIGTSEEKIRKRLTAEGNDIFTSRKQISQFTDHAAANALLNDLENTPHAFVIVCIMDRQMRAELAWQIPYRLAEKLGTFNFSRLIQLNLGEIEKLMQNLHRYPKKMSTNILSALQLIDSRYNQRASEIWAGKPSSATVVYRFLEFRGVGPKIATMAVNILTRRFKVPLADYYSIDISPDVHVQRVFRRLGLIREKGSIEEIVYRARALHPEFPGILDYPVWEIGHQWCRPRHPICPECYMNDLCPSAGKL